MNRENKTTLTGKEDIAVYGGYNITFNYSIAEGATKPAKVIATAEKQGNSANMPFMPHEEIEIIVESGETKVKCPAGTPKDLIDAIEVECKTILEII